jgi:AraC-like DNA-binding protein
MMAEYDPKGHGKAKSEATVWFREAAPPSHLSEVVHRFLELKTPEPLAADYRFHALPDACTYIIFNQLDPEIAGVAKLRTSSEEFNLGTWFHYVNIRFFPGVWQSTDEAITDGSVETRYAGILPLVDVNRTLQGRVFEAQQEILVGLVERLVEQKIVMANTVVQRIIRGLDEINSVKDMAEASRVSSRQLQRILKQSTGFAPHDFLKVIRLQKALNDKDTDSYADQSHFIRSFRSATGYTPGRYLKKYDV